MSRLRIKLDLKAFGRPRPEWSLVDVETLDTVGDIAKNLARYGNNLKFFSRNYKSYILTYIQINRFFGCFLTDS